MTDEPFEQVRDETPTIELRVFRHGELVHQELCESEEQALLVAENWSELGDVECEVDDLSIHHRLGDILEPEPGELDDEDHAEQVELDTQPRRYD